MKLIQVAEQNKRYYTKEFIHGFNTGAKTQYEADSKERRGRWETEIRTEYDGKHATYACSVCGNMALDEFAYCPNCGARMEAKENEND